MGIRKLTPQQLAELRSRPKLTTFWEGYFSDITVELNRLFFSIFRESVSVKPVSLNLIDSNEYFENSQHTVTQFFKIHPHKNYGFYNLPYETIDLLLSHLLGGNLVSGTKRTLSKVDQSIIHILSNKLADVLQAPMIKDNRKLKFEFLDINEDILKHNLTSNNQYICVQQYVIQLQGEYYYFDLAFTNQFLNQFSLI